MNLKDFDEKAEYIPSPAYTLGGDDFLKGKSITQNRFTDGTKEHDDWEHGWCDAEGYDCYRKDQLL